MYNSDTEVLFPVRAIPGLKGLRGPQWDQLSDYILTQANEQEKLAKEYKDKPAHPDPDIYTPWIEEGDIVNGEVYIGKPI